MVTCYHSHHVEANLTPVWKTMMHTVPCNPFFLHWFGECLRSVRDYVGFCVAMSSICFWIIAQFPQYYKNYKTKTVEALSPWFLAQWLLGDTGNIMGCLLTGDQQPTTTYTAMYFVIADIILMTQYVYYGTLARRRERIYSYMKRNHRHHRHAHHRAQHHSNGDADGVVVSGRDACVRPAGHASSSLRTAGGLLGVVAGAGVAEAASVMGVDVHTQALLTMSNSHRPKWMRAAGQMCGYVSSVLYLSSRIPQIWKNHQRQSVEGLALAMFFCAVCANVAYGSGILIRAENWAAVVQQAPWIVGSLGTVALDCVILCQFAMYKGAKPGEQQGAEGAAAGQGSRDHHNNSHDHHHHVRTNHDHHHTHSNRHARHASHRQPLLTSVAVQRNTPP